MGVEGAGDGEGKGIVDGDGVESGMRERSGLFGYCCVVVYIDVLHDVNRGICAANALFNAVLVLEGEGRVWDLILVERVQPSFQSLTVEDKRELRQCRLYGQASQSDGAFLE